jgi:endopolygalacturonase
MARLPVPNGDNQTWGRVLNDFLRQSHEENGFLKQNSVGTNNIRNDAISENKLSPELRAKISGSGETAEVMSSTSDANVNITSFGADPTGQKDSTAAIQKAINTAHERGGGAVEFPAGKYKVSSPFIELKGHVTCYGHGNSTVVFATGSGNANDPTGVFHIGTYNTPNSDPNCTRAGLRDMFIKTANGDFAAANPIPGVCGVLLNTDWKGAKSQDPDAVHSVRNLEIWDMDRGLVVVGKDDQAIQFYNIRIRRALNQGLLVGKPGSGGAADNRFWGMDVSSANRNGNGSAGIEVYTSQCKFNQCTSWYNRRQQSSGAIDPAKNGGSIGDGAGWRIKGTKNMFIECTAQENGGHGFIVEYGSNQFVSCLGETSGCNDSSAEKNPEHAANFCILGGENNQFVGCRAENPRWKDNTYRGAKTGFYVSPYIVNTRVDYGVVALTQQEKTDGVAVVNKSLSSKSLASRGHSRVEVNELLYSSFPRDRDVISDKA